MNRSKKILLLILCIALLFVPVTSFFYIAGHMNHECIGVDCHICAQIGFSIHNINISKIYIIAALYALIVFVTALSICPSEDVICHSGITLISLKVELLN